MAEWVRQGRHTLLLCLKKTCSSVFQKPCSSVFQSQQGFKSIGYHFVVRLDGEVERGRFPNAEIRGHRYYAAKDCPLHEHQDTNLHDKLKLLSLQVSDEPHLLLNTDSADYTEILAQ